MKKKPRTFNPNKARIGQSYTVQEISELYGIHKGSASLWVSKEGLQTIDKKKPYLIQGKVLRDFLRQRRAKKKKTCKPDEFYCCKCHLPRKAWENVVDVKIKSKETLCLCALCAVCNTRVFRGGSVKRLSEYQKIFSIQEIQEGRIDDRPIPFINIEMRGKNGT